MNDSIKESKIIWENAKFLGLNLLEFYAKAGQQIAQRISKKFIKSNKVSVVCGLGGNGADGIATALGLEEIGFQDITVYLIGRPSNFTNVITKKLWTYAKRSSSVNLLADSTADDIESSDIVIEALTGTGLEGAKLNRRFKAVIKRIAHLKAKVIAIDKPTLHYSPNLTYSILFPKTENAEIIDVGFPLSVFQFCGPGEQLALWEPNTKTHKKKNGTLLSITSDSTHSKFINQGAKIYNTEVSQFLIPNDNRDLEKLIYNSDCLLLSNIEKSFINQIIVKELFKTFSSKPKVILGNTLKLLDITNFKPLENCVLILERKDLQILFNSKTKVTTLEGKVKRFCKEQKTNIILIGSKTALYNHTGDFRIVRNIVVFNDGYDYSLASKIASYITKNDIWLSMRAGMSSQ